MGAWGYGPFENDDAADWLDELIEASDIEVLRRALEPRWLDYVYMQVTKGSVIVAAAEVLAAGLGKGAADLPDDVKRWVRLNAMGKKNPRVVAARGRLITGCSGP